MVDIENDDKLLNFFVAGSKSQQVFLLIDYKKKLFPIKPKFF